MTDRLLITSLPELTLADVSAAIAEAVHWFDRLALTSEQELERAQAKVSLRQAQWHVSAALYGPEHVPATYINGRKP